MTIKDETADALREDRFWLIVHEPGLVPDRKGPWKSSEKARILREFIAAKPTAYLHVLTIGHDGPWVDHGPEALQMLDGRSMGVGRKHNQRTKSAHLAALSDRATDREGETEHTAIAENIWQRACEGREGYCSSDLQDAAKWAISEAFRIAEDAARAVDLPAHYQWSEGNREKFHFGRDTAASAIRYAAPARQPIADLTGEEGSDDEQG